MPGFTPRPIRQLTCKEALTLQSVVLRTQQSGTINTITINNPTILLKPGGQQVHIIGGGQSFGEGTYVIDIA
ncbi:MAG: hypothetical protein V1668_01470 [Patescibacteria group bacterium]